MNKQDQDNRQAMTRAARNAGYRFNRRGEIVWFGFYAGAIREINLSNPNSKFQGILLEQYARLNNTTQGATS